MTDILLLRHASAMSESPDGRDASRPLRPKGMRDAQQVGQWLTAHACRPGRVLCSPARRAVMTAEIVLKSLRDTREPVLEPDIYDAVPGTLIDVLDRHAPEAPLLLIGHNPGLEQLVGLMAQGDSAAARGMPPAGLVWLQAEFPLQPGSARVQAFWSPPGHCD